MTPAATALHEQARRRLLEADAAWRPTPPELIARHLPYPCRWPCELGPPEAFSDEPGPADYFDLWPDHDPACMGAESAAVARRIASSCAGWPHRPTGQEFYDALRAERPTARQRAIVGMWAVEASRLDMLDAHGERVYSWRRLVAALHRCGPFATFATFRWLNRRALVPEYDGVRLWSG